MAFIGLPPVGHEVNHMDGVKANNRATNLEYVTSMQNRQHAVRLGLTARGLRNGHYTHPDRTPRGDRNGSRTRPERLKRGDEHYARTSPEKLCRGDKHKNAKLTEPQVREILRLYSASDKHNGLITEIAQQYGVGRMLISRIVRRKTWKHIRP
jgi:hypothetical protein